MEEKNDSLITLNGDDGEIQVEVIEQTVIEGITYLLVATLEGEDVEEDDVDECMILKDVSKTGDTDASYVVVEGDEEEKAFKVFEKILGEDDINITK